MTKKTDPPRGGDSGFSLRRMVGAVVAFQVLAAIFFTYDIFGPLVGLRSQPLDWRFHELIEIFAVTGLALGSLYGLVALRQTERRRQAAEEKLAELSRNFHELLETRFAEWELTPAERDVAFFVMKGFSTQEIAALRETSEGTVKAQTNAIYRKAEVTGRAQLLSHFIEDLMHGDAAAKDLTAA